LPFKSELRPISWLSDPWYAFKPKDKTFVMSQTCLCPARQRSVTGIRMETTSECYKRLIWERENARAHGSKTIEAPTSAAYKRRRKLRQIIITNQTIEPDHEIPPLPSASPSPPSPAPAQKSKLITVIALESRPPHILVQDRNKDIDSQNKHMHSRHNHRHRSTGLGKMAKPTEPWGRERELRSVMTSR
jgi:hypothetical protein